MNKKRIIVSVILFVFLILIAKNAAAFTDDYRDYKDEVNELEEELENYISSGYSSDMEIYEKYDPAVWAYVLSEIAYDGNYRTDDLWDEDKRALEVVANLKDHGYFEQNPKALEISDKYIKIYEDNKQDFGYLTSSFAGIPRESSNAAKFFEEGADLDNLINNKMSSGLSRYSSGMTIAPDNPGVISTSLDEILNAGDKFLEQGDLDTISEEDMQTLSNVIYSIALAIGIIAIFVVGGIIAIKYITSGLEGKAETKQMLIPYIVGVVVLLGSFTIWKIVLTILQG